ncbi:Crp/Fnr family transcriptional regulator [Parahaliea mediterranea]|uniref:Crp/Fnr family transcriptional regulator n=1 Tax=Parahaliea mediterranea TaxID=651086 RepID=UPI0014735F47|nr:Crp/Fnr family transcriptional regulator [Parahaliea mediterranea]
MRVIPHMHDFVSGLPPAGREAFERMSSLRQVAAGSAVYRQGDSSDEVYQLVAGVVQLCNYTEDGREIITAQFRAGDCIGEMGMIDGLPRVSHALALEDCVLRVLGRRQFEALVAEFPELNQTLLLTLCRRLRALYALHEEGGLNLHQRVARAIHRLAFTHGRYDEDNARYVDLSQEELARLMGASRQSINRELQALRKAGVVELRYGRIYVNDLEKLAKNYGYLTGMEQITTAYDAPE